MTLLLSAPQGAYAAVGDNVCITRNTANFFGFKPWNACFPGGEVQIEQLADLWLIALPLIEDGIKLAGYLAAGLIIWGGIKYSKSQGNSSEIAAARTIILNALIGLAIAVISVVIVQTITQGFAAT